MAQGAAGRGRPKGAKNKVPRRREAEIAASGLTPLQYMLRELRNPKNSKERRDELAKAAAPYVHPKLASVQHSTDPDKPFELQVIERKIVRPPNTDR